MPSPCGVLSSVQCGCCFVLFGRADADVPFLQWKVYWLAMDGSDTSSTLTSSDSVDCHEHIIWNPVLELLFRMHVGSFMEAYFDEADFGVRLLTFCFGCPVRQSGSSLS